MASLGYSFYPVHPGEVIKEEMEARNISQREFARQDRKLIAWLSKIPRVAAML